MAKRAIAPPQLFLVNVGTAPAADITDPSRAGCFPATGLLLPQATTGNGNVDLFIAASDLVAFADLQAVSLFKPVVLPFDLVDVRPGRINAVLRTDDGARRFARHVLAGLPALTHPVR